MQHADETHRGGLVHGDFSAYSVNVMDEKNEKLLEEVFSI